MKSFYELLKNKKRLILFISIKFLNSFIGLLSNYFIVRKISLNDFGLYSITLTVLGFLTMFGFSWSSSSIIYFGAKEKEEKGNICETFWSRNYIVMSSFFIMIVLFLFNWQRIEDYLGFKGNFLLIVWVLVSVLLDIVSTYFLAVNKQVFSSLILFLGKATSLILIVICELNLEKLIYIKIICEAVGLIFFIKVDKKDIKIPKLKNKINIKILNFGLWQLFGFSGIFLINFGDNLIIKKYLSLKDVGIYNSAYQIFTAIAGISLMITSYYAPVIVQAITKKNKQILKKIFLRERFFLILLVTLPHITIIIFAKQLIVFIYGINYIEAVNILRVLMVCSFIRYATAFNILIFNGLKKHKIGQFFNILRAVLNIIFDIIFIKHFGLIGAAYGTLGALLLMSIVSNNYASKQLNIYFNSIKKVGKSDLISSKY